MCDVYGAWCPPALLPALNAYPQSPLTSRYPVPNVHIAGFRITRARPEDVAQHQDDAKLHDKRRSTCIHGEYILPGRSPLPSSSPGFRLNHAPRRRDLGAHLRHQPDGSLMRGAGGRAALEADSSIGGSSGIHP